MDKNVKRELIYAFRNYRKLIETVVQSTVDLAERDLSVNYGGERVKTSLTNKREDKIVNGIDKSFNSWRWCYVVEKTLDCYKFTIKDKIIRYRWFDRMSVRNVCRKCFVGEATFYRWQTEILETAEKWAAEYHLI